MAPIKRHMSYIISSTRYVTKMVKMMEMLDDIIWNVKRRMEYCVSNNLDLPTRLPAWLEEFEKIKNNVESILSDRSNYLNMKFWYETAQKASMITLKIKLLIKEIHVTVWTDTRLPIKKVYSSKESTPTSLTNDAQSDFKSREGVFKDALEFLKQDHKAQVLALCGMGGVGKTTMMEQLIDIVVDKEMFKWVVKVVIGQKTNMSSIQNAIAEFVGQPLIEETLTVRATLLFKKYEHMLEEGDILFILDDIWEVVELKEIGLSPLPKGCKLILTSRFENICAQIAADANCVLIMLRVHILEKAEAQNFFWKIIEMPKEDDPRLDQIGCEIVRRCGYLPLAVKLVALTLKHQTDKNVWRRTLDRLEMNDLDDNIQYIMQITYNQLKEVEDKEILFLCALFPVDCDIPIEDLTRYAWGLKLLKEVQTLGEARDQTNTCVSNLKRANLLMDSDYAGCVKIHDLVLAFVLGTDLKGEHTWIINHGDTTYMSAAKMNKLCTRISLTCMGMSELPIDFRCPNLLLLKLMQGDESLVFPEDFYEKIEKLEVAAYEKMQYPLLPGSLQCSINLRTLCFRDCLLMFDLSPIGNLVSLEVLSFSGCRIRRLPSTVGNLKKLKLLDLTGCVHLCIDEGVLKGLSKLEELYMRVSDKKAISFKDGSYKELVELSMNLFALEIEFCNNDVHVEKMSFKTLERFKISMGCFLEEVGESNIHLFENTLMLVTTRSKLLESRVHILFQKTKVLHLEVDDMDDFKDVLVESRHPHEDPFYNLRVLNVSKCSNLKSLFTFSMENCLKNLEHLTISSCRVLEVLVCIENSKAGVIEFPKLKSLRLDGLPKLVRLCNNVNVIELPELVNLELYGLPKFTCIYSKNEGSSLSSNISSILNEEVVIPRLERLEIGSMENLKEIWPFHFDSIEEVNLCTLKEIRVSECNSLVNLFPNNLMPLLHHLEKLVVWSCGSIEVLFNIDLECVGEIELGCSSLRRISVYGSEKLREIWSVKGVNTYVLLVITAFQAVESISIRDCKSFRNIFTPSTMIFDFRALAKLHITDWGQRWNNTASKDEMVESREQSSVISKGELSEVNEENIAFSSNIVLRSFHHLRGLGLSNYRGVDVVFEIESATNWNNEPPQLLPHLQSLRLYYMERMSHVWKCHWNTHQMPPAFLFHNLTTIEVAECNRIKYLFSLLMAKHLCNLKSIEISSCNDIEEVVSIRDDRDEEMTTSMSTHTSTTSFPHLDNLRLECLRCLERIDGGSLWDRSDGYRQILQSSKVDVTCWSLYQYSKKIHIWHCPALSSVIPSHAVGQIQTLEELKVSFCNSMKHIFEIEGVNRNTNDEGEISDAMTIPRWTNMNLLELPNLKILSITSCDLLEHILISSALESLKQLEDLTVNKCKAMQVIVKEDTEHTMASKVVVFPRLKSLTLADLPNLKGFLLGMDEFNFMWPLLDEVKIYGCPQLNKFMPGGCITPKLRYIHTSFGKYNLECGLNFHIADESLTMQGPQSISLLHFPWSLSNLIQVHVEDHNYYRLLRQHILFPPNELLKLQNLEKLHVKPPSVDYFSKTEEVFGTTQGQGTDDDVNKTQTVVTFPSLKEVILTGLSKLRCIWKSSRWTSLNFPSLKMLSVGHCSVLEHVFTYDMVGSLLQLQRLEVVMCKNMEVIIKQREDYETEVKDIVFPCLKSLTLDRLNSLKGFSLGMEVFHWPSLHTLEIKDCPELTVFTSQESITPKLKVIDTSFGRSDASQGLNSFIRTMKQEGLRF